MLRGMWQLTSKADALTPLITVMLCAMVGGILWALSGSPRIHWIVGIVFGGIALIVSMSSLIRVWRRYRRLRGGRCANLRCRGVVQRSERVQKGFVVCPTCQKVWPEIRGIRFRLTGRDERT